MNSTYQNLLAGGGALLRHQRRLGGRQHGRAQGHRRANVGPLGLRDLRLEVGGKTVIFNPDISHVYLSLHVQEL